MRVCVYLLLIAAVAGVVATFLPLAHGSAAITFWDFPSGSAARGLGYLAFVPFVALLVIGGIALLIGAIDGTWPLLCVGASTLGLTLLGLGIAIFHAGGPEEAHVAIDWTGFAVAGAANLVVALVVTALFNWPEVLGTTEAMLDQRQRRYDRRQSERQARREGRGGAVREVHGGDGVAHAGGHVAGQIGVADVEHVDRAVGVD
jgi:hypothetical protein